MEDQSHLDRQYFIDSQVYNCPFCNRNNVTYKLTDHYSFNWNNEKKCIIIFIKCTSCDKTSMHLSYNEDLLIISQRSNSAWINSQVDERIDSNIFYSVPTSFFTIDNRIPKDIRELINEAEGCIKMNYMTGASACTRKAIYELTIDQKCEGNHYEDKIKFLKRKFSDIDETLFDTLSQIQQMTSDKVHEQSWDKWEAKNLKFILETVKEILHEIYVLPEIKRERINRVKQLHQESLGKPENK